MDRMILSTEEPLLAHRNGQTITVLSQIMHVRFSDGFETYVFPDELTVLTAAAPAYRDTL